MATSQNDVDHIVENCAGAGSVSARRMFGEWGVYCDGIFFGVICGGGLFVKPTAAGRAFGDGLPEAPAYDGAKPSLAIPEDRVEDADWLSSLVRITIDNLPAKKTKAR